MTGKEDICDNERSNIDELRRRMKDHMTPELYEDENVFERFLIARNQNLDAAELMLKNHMQWRKDNRVDTIREEFKPDEVNKVLVEYDVMSRMCFDKEGSPVLYCAFGKLDARGMFKCSTLHDFTLCLLKHFENFIHEMKQKSKEFGKPVNQWVMIFDYEGFLLSNATHKPFIQLLASMMSMYEANYPERLKAAYLINGSFVFQICFAMCKPFLTGHTINKVKILGSDFRDELLKIIHPDELPAFLGGNRTDPEGNPRCMQTIKFGGVIPELYYRQRRKMSVIPGAKLLTINRFSKEKVEVEVIYPGSNIEWRFQVRNRNINFAVFLKRNDEEEAEEIIPRERVETVDSSETGMCRCPKAGIYVLEFDNTFSWLHSKHVLYTVTVNRPLEK